MTYGEIKKIKNPLHKRLLNAEGQLAEFKKEIEKGSKRGDLNLVIKSEMKVAELRGKLNELIGEDLELKVSQLDEQLNDILKKLQQEGYSLNF